MNPNQNAKHINAEKLNQQLGTMKRTSFEETSDPLEIKRSRLETTTESNALVPGNGGEYQRLTQLAHTLQNPSYASTQKEDDGKGDGLAGCNINLVASTSTATAATVEGSHGDCLTSEKLKYSNLMTAEDSLSAIQKAGGVAPKAESFDSIELLLLPNVPDQEGRHDMSSQPHLVAGGGDNISNELNKIEVAGTSAVTAGGANVVRQGGKYNANRLAVTTSKVVSRIKIDPNLKSSSLMITTKKMSPDVSQTTAKVSIGNTTISVPLLKPINSTQLMQSQKLNKESPKPIYPTMPVGRIFNVKPKVHPTIVSLSQLQIKPITTKLLNAKVVSKRVLPTSSTTLNTFVPQQGDIAPGKQATVQAKNCSQPTFKKKPVAKYDMTVGEEEAKLSTFPKVAKKPDKPPYAEGKEEAKDAHEYIDTSEALSVTTTPSPVDAVNKLKSAPGNFEKLLDEKTIMSSMATADATPKASFATTLHVKKHVVKMADAPSQEEPTTVAAAIHVMPPISKEDNEEGTPKQEIIVNQSNLKSKEFVGPSADSSTDKVEKPCAALEKSKPVPNSQLPSAKSDDNQNALLKQLLQNSSNSQSSKLLKTHMKASPTPVTSSNSSIGNQLISTRKVINVRAPSLGLVSSLEAQLARPVIPPVSTNLITPQIQHEMSSSSMQQNQAKSESQIAGVTTSEEENFQKQCTSKQIVTKETSFISNPNLIPDHLKPHTQKPNGEDTCQAANIEDVNPDTSEKPSEIKGGLNYKEPPINKMSKPSNDSTLPMETIIYSGESQLKVHPPIQETPKHANEHNKSEVPFKITETKSSDVTELDKTIFSASNNKGAVIERKGLLQTKQKSPAGAKINLEDANQNQMGREQLLDGGGALAADAADNKQQTNNSNSKIDTIRKKRKRDTQKLRRPILKSNKDSTLANFTGAMSCASQKKKIKKMFKVDEDHDHYIDKIMMHMRNMESLEILEPLLDSNFTIGKFYERNNKFNSNVLSGDGDELFQEPASMNFGTAQFSTIKDFYDMDSTKVKRMGVNATAMHNEFYDQEFCSFLKKNEYNKMAKFIRQISAQQKNGNIPMKVNRNNFVSPDNGTFPGLFVKNQNRESSIGRMSPVVPYVNYCDNTITQPNAAIKENIHFIKDTVSHDKDRFETNETVIISLPLKVESRVFSVLKDLASILNIIPPHTFRVLKTGCHKSPKQSELSNCYSKNSKSHEFITSVSLQKIFNGRKKMCRSCGKTLTDLGIRQFSSIPNTIHGKVYSMAIYLCSKLCLEEYKEQQNRGRLAAFPKRLPNVATFQNVDTKMSKDDNCSDERLFNSSDMDHNNVILKDEFANIDVITPKSFLENYETSESVREMYADKRKCSFCNQLGDGLSNGPSRLLNYDHEKWVHLNCALWSNCVYETLSGSLMNFQNALDMSLKQHCSLCQDLGATVKCCKTRCGSVYHLPCAIRAVCVFYKNKSIVCPHHASKTEKENELTSLQVERRVYIERDERLQINSLLNNQDQVLRVGSLTFLNFGHLVPNQVEHFHTANNVYPVGYKSMRFYWSMKRPNKRCRYICSISEVGGRPEFSVKVQEPMESEVEIREASADEAWNKILKQISELRKKYKMIELYPEFLTGDDLFGLTEPNAIRIIENLPGIETLSNYRCKYSRQSFHDSPLPLNTTGAARTEPKHHQLINCRKPHTQRTCSVYNQRDVHASSSMIAGEVACPYSKQFVHSKSSQYKKMKQEWRNNVFLARSKIQGLGLYAARDIEKHTMIIEYIGEIIRTEVSEIREKQYEAKNRGIYMFRLDEERVVDATLSGGLARYINHSCNPNCVTETVDVDREHRIIIFAKRKISRGEELCYDYKFDIEDDANKLACMCTASNCRKWMN